MKITYSDEILICQGKSFEEYLPSNWGPVQFPTIHRDTQGNWFIRVHWVNDSWDEFGNEMYRWFKSTDNCQTWTPTDSASAEGSVGTLLSNGDRILFPVPESILFQGEDIKKLKKPRIWNNRLPSDRADKEQDGSWPYPAFSTINALGGETIVYDFDTLPDEYAKKQWTMNRIKKGEPSATQEIVPFDFPNMSACMQRFSHIDGYAMLPPWPICQIKTDPQGNVWVGSYTGAHLNPYTKGPDPRSASVLFKSTDNAKSFKLQSYIPYCLDTTKHPTAYWGGGFNELDYEFMDDGSIIALLRTADVFMGVREWNTMYFARSVDGGKTFSEPVEFDNIGVLPKLCKLSCGVTLAAYGRPGIFIRPIDNETGLKWGERVEIMTPKDRSHLMKEPPARPSFHQWAGSCCNVDIKAIDANHALLTYSDFFYPDQSGKTDKKLKSILARIITVED